MKKHLVVFSSMADLNEFISQIDLHQFEINRKLCTIIGYFSERELELAKNGFAAPYETLSEVSI